ncbi:ADP-ribosyltransferase [Erwinia amylovora]|uniref:NAD(+)--protein-arginine ADP-ribosyltransferase n=3 Tax=Erwinia amylovora TaxID=552 RepID=A0A831ERH0_ERWAM|nr:ADP-ribosyltransferase [Erwinia amylovora]CDK15800.1 hypothetical protein LA635_2176 [Erwinia amylovora LA635]CDK19166.1 hypothetical protein LA636_2174 [Erwinia amylovora LA636]CDK22537.1 hypothetical protein LA637_2177 [Erwinia amylovora LA637]ATZ12083.1 hypothetical protein AD997_11715 [Erwinia amylovora]EKV53395.1 hypothetical protein EaACW_2399 [Erwinia amylovora ACW56400]
MPRITSEAASAARTSLLIIPDQSSVDDGKKDRIDGELTLSIISVASSAIEMNTSLNSSVIQCWQRAVSGLNGRLRASESITRSAEERELQEMSVKGAELQLLAENGILNGQHAGAFTPPAFKLKGKFAWFAGAALFTAGAGAWAYTHHLSGAGGMNRPPADWHTDSSAMTSLQQPEPLPLAAAIWAPREATTTEKLLTDDVKRVKIGYSCLEERQSLKLSDILRQIGNTLSNPVEALAHESMIIAYYNKLGRCPDDLAIQHLATITSRVDQTVSALLSLFPAMTPLVIMQRIGGKLFTMLADDLEGKPLNPQDAIDMNNQVLMVAKVVADISPKDKNGQIIEKKAVLPEKTFIRYGRLHIYINGNEYLLVRRGEKYIAIGDDREVEVRYSIKNKSWSNVSKNAVVRKLDTSMARKPAKNFISYLDVFDIEMANRLKGVRQLDARAFIRIKPNKEGIYRYTLRGKKNQLLALKLNDKFYRVSKGTTQRHLAIYGRPECEVFLFYGKYYLANKKQSIEVTYSPCRLKRAPVLPCMYFSGDIGQILTDNHEAGLIEDKVGELHSDKKYPAIMVASNGKTYIKHNGVLFRAKIVYKGTAEQPSDAEVRIYGRKLSGLLKRKKEFYLASGFFSLVNGESFLTSKTENTMELFNFSRPTAEAYHLLQDFDDNSGGITSDEYTSIRNYGGNSYFTINGFLLENMPEQYLSPHIREQAFQHVKNIRTLLKKLPSIQGVVYRGGKPNSQGMMDLAELKSGDIISSKKFISASTEQQVARNFAASANGIRYKIHVVKAAHPVMLYTGKLTEAEILIEDNTVFRCKAVAGRDIELEEVVNPSDEEKASLKYVFI